MAIRKTDESLGRKPLRLRPGVILALVLVFVQDILPLVAGDVMIGEFSLGLAGMVGGLVCTLIIVVWWLFFSRASWLERLGALVVMVAAVFATRLVVHPSIAGGAQGYLLYVVFGPTLALALVAAAVAGGRVSASARRPVIVCHPRIGAGLWTLVRTEGVVGNAVTDLEWRWTPTAEERLLARGDDEPKPMPDPVWERQPLLARSRAVPSPTSAAPAIAEEPKASPAAQRPQSIRRADGGAVQPPRRDPTRSVKTRTSVAGEPTGLAFADQRVTMSFVVCESRPTGRLLLRSSCGAGRLDRAGRRLRSMAICSTRKSSVARTRSSRATACRPAIPVWRHRDPGSLL